MSGALPDHLLERRDDVRVVVVPEAEVQPLERDLAHARRAGPLGDVVPGIGDAHDPRLERDVRAELPGPAEGGAHVVEERDERRQLRARPDDVGTDDGDPLLRLGSGVEGDAVAEGLLEAELADVVEKRGPLELAQGRRVEVHLLTDRHGEPGHAQGVPRPGQPGHLAQAGHREERLPEGPADREHAADGDVGEEHGQQEQRDRHPADDRVRERDEWPGGQRRRGDPRPRATFVGEDPGEATPFTEPGDECLEDALDEAAGDRGDEEEEGGRRRLHVPEGDVEERPAVEAHPADDEDGRGEPEEASPDRALDDGMAPRPGDEPPGEDAHPDQREHRGRGRARAVEGGRRERQAEGGRGHQRGERLPRDLHRQLFPEDHRDDRDEREGRHRPFVELGAQRGDRPDDDREHEENEARPGTQGRDHAVASGSCSRSSARRREASQGRSSAIPASASQRATAAARLLPSATAVPQASATATTRAPSGISSPPSPCGPPSPSTRSLWAATMSRGPSRKVTEPMTSRAAAAWSRRTIAGGAPSRASIPTSRIRAAVVISSTAFGGRARPVATARAASATSRDSSAAPGCRRSSARTKGVTTSWRVAHSAAYCWSPHWMTKSVGRKKTTEAQPSPAGAQRMTRMYAART